MNSHSTTAPSTTAPSTNAVHSTAPARSTRTRTGRRLALGGVVGLGLALAVPMAASAHVGVTPDTTAAGSYANLTFAVPHGCDGSPTTEVRITIPESVITVTPTVNPNWDVAEVPSETDPDHTAEVVYTAKTPLADGLRDTFTLSIPLPADAAGDAVEFPVLQTCEVGSTAWDEETVDGEEEPEHPAPTIVLTEPTGDAHGGHGAAGSADDEGADDGLADGATAATSASADPAVGTAIGLGVGGLVVGLVGVALAVWALRRRSA